MEGRVETVSRDSSGSVTFAFAVARSWKQNLSGAIMVTSAADCRFEPVNGANYVLFLLQTKSGAYETAVCLGNQPMEKAGQVLRFLRQRTRSAS